jgi:hypothetical protein
VVIQVINKRPRKIVLIPDDNEPAQGFALAPKTISLITKTVRSKQPIIFTAIDAESDGELLINEQSNVSLVPTISKDHIESLTITSGKNFLLEDLWYSLTLACELRVGGKLLAIQTTDKTTCFIIYFFNCLK